MEYTLKRISTAGIPEAIAKAGLYRSLNEPEEAESICRDILAVDPQHLGAEGVERSDPHLLGPSTNQRFHPVPHLTSGFVCEGDRQNVPGENTLLN